MKASKSKPKRILNSAQIKAVFERFAREMTRAYGNLDAIVFIGIRTRGPYVAKRLAEVIRKRHGKEIPIGEMDITLYRDDLNALVPGGTIDHTRIPFEIANRIVVLFDDVLNTGRRRSPDRSGPAAHDPPRGHDRPWWPRASNCRQLRR
jgi:pyrimidine operon attenuation protein/uracil phosphoribosyltransferase